MRARFLSLGGAAFFLLGRDGRLVAAGGSKTSSESVSLSLDEVSGGGMAAVIRGGDGSLPSESVSDSEELSVLEGAENNDPRWEAVRRRLQRADR